MTYFDEDNVSRLPSVNLFGWRIASSALPQKPEEVIIVLNSDAYFIGDIDDLQFDWLPVVKRLEQEAGFSFRFYRTFKGFRFFVTNKTIYTFQDESDLLFSEFSVDPAYKEISQIRGHYAARLSPKNRGNGVVDYTIASLLYQTVPTSELDLEIQTMILTHDYFCSERIYYGIFREQSSGRVHDNEEYEF